MKSVKDYYSYSPSASQSFGAPRDGGRRRHRGTDISYSSTPGTPVPALLGGKVIGKRSPSGAHGFGYQVTIQSTYNGVTEIISYAHGRVASPLKVGQVISAGTKVLEEGRTGATNGSCVHIERKRNGVFVDPMPLFRAVVKNQAQPAGTGATGSPSTMKKSLLMEGAAMISYVNMPGESGKRRGGTYMIFRDDSGKIRAQFVSRSMTPGLPTFDTDRAIREVQSQIPGMR